MKKTVPASCVLALTLAMLTSASAQAQSSLAVNKQPAPRTPTTSQIQENRPNATRARISGQEVKPPATHDPTGKPILNAHAKTVSITPSARTPISATSRSTSPANEKPVVNITPSRSRTVTDSSAKPAGTTPSGLASNASANTTTASSAPTQVYRIGVKDVLDIQLVGHSGKDSTLFTVVEGGVLEYPLAGGPIAAVGMTTSEVAALLRQRIKILENPNVAVKVRDYASHSVTITGFVAAPGVKNLRREAVPLYTLLAEALVIPEAARATITRPGRNPIVVDLKDPNLSSTLVLPGDVIKVSGMPVAPTEFFFIGGEVSSPGQKPYHAGVTLTQAILASGGATKVAGSKVRVSRQGADGRLLTEEYNLRKIEDGKSPDPALQKGDRIHVTDNR